MKPAALYFKSAPFDWMCITSVTISHKAITSEVECASSSRKQQKYGSVKPGQLRVNPEKQLLLQQPSWLLLLVQVGSTCLTAASEINIHDELFKAIFRFQNTQANLTCFSLAWVLYNISVHVKCRTLPSVSAAVCATGVLAEAWASQHSSLLLLISLTPSASYFYHFVSQLKCILHRLL